MIMFSLQTDLGLCPQVGTYALWTLNWGHNGKGKFVAAGGSGRLQVAILGVYKSSLNICRLMRKEFMKERFLFFIVLSFISSHHESAYAKHRSCYRL